NVGAFCQLVVGTSGKSPTRAVIAIFADVHRFIMSRLPREISGLVRHRFDIVDAAAIPIIRTADENAPALIVAEPLANGAGGFNGGATTDNGRVTTHAAERNCWTLTSGLGDEIDGATDAIGVHIRLERFVDFHGFDQVGGNSVKFNLANTRFGRWDIDAVE